jgi:hypothetical protein
VWHSIVARHGVRREIVLCAFDNTCACDQEVRLITELRTYVKFGGANMTMGGEGTVGWSPSVETRKKMRDRKLGTKQTEEHKQKIQDSRATYYASPAGELARKAVSELFTDMWQDPVYHERMRLTRVGEDNGRAVLTEADVIVIRHEWDQLDRSKRGATKQFCVRWARTYGVTSENVYGVVTRRSWKHI